MARIHKTLPAGIRRLLVPRVVRHKPGLEGQWVTEDGVIELGSRCGPTAFDLPSLVHEMCHLVEIDDSRVTTWGWGLRVRTVVICGRECYEPTTKEPVERECRVLAFQMNVQSHVRMNHSIADHVSAMRYVPGYCFVPGKTDEARDGWCCNEIERLRFKPEFSYDAFEREWWRKVEVIRSRTGRKS